MITVYGIKNCNTMKKAFDWLNKHQVPYTFHDYKKEGITIRKLEHWLQQRSWETLVNRKGMTWRKLTDIEKENINNDTAAISLMQEKTSIIKRPLIEQDDKIILLGFDEAEYQVIWL